MPKVGVVIFGASTYDYHSELNNPRFANSAQLFVKTIGDPDIVPDCSVRSLNLYDQPARPSETLEKITDFVSEDFDTVIIYYCGHGDISRAFGEYRVFLRNSRRDRRHGTMLDVIGLIRDVERISAQKTIFFVLDACYSGSVISQEFMDAGGAEALIDRSLWETITQRGIAVFAATSGLDVALAKKSDKLSLFTGAFVHCLNNGIACQRDAKMLSWLDVRDEIVRSTRERLGQDAPVPKITSLDEKHGDVTRLPFFLNRAYMPSEKPAVTTEELYWRNLPDDAPLTVLHDFLAKFPDGIFAPLARALADRRIGRASDAELQEFLRYHPKTKFKKQIAARRKTLRLDRIQNGADVEALEHILAEDPEGEFINEVKQRIDVLARERAEAEAWACVETSSNPGELKQFLTLHPDGRFSQLARTRLDQLRATSGLEPPQPPGPPGAVGAIASSFAENWRRYAAVAALLLLGGVAAALIGGRKPLEHEARDGLARSEETERARLAGVTIEQQKALDAAGTSLEPLRIFVQQCNATACTVAQQARDRLAKAEEAERSRLAQMAAADRAALDAAGTNLGQLRTFVQQCTSSSCTVAPQARDRLAKAEEAERARLAQMAADRKALDAAGADIAQLRKFVQQCNANSCTVAPEARDRLAKAEEVDRARLAQIAADRKALDAAGTNLGQLRTFVQQCTANSCAVLLEARDRLAKADEAERARLAQIAADRKALDAAGTNLGQLRTFVQQCTANSCTVLLEARDRLAKADEAERARLAQIAADRKALDAAGANLGQLRTFVQQCDANSCSVAPEARARLTNAEEAAKRTLPVSFNTFVNYDIDQNDIEITHNIAYSDCLARCMATPDGKCVGFIFDKWKNSCYLKSNVGPLLQDPRYNAVIRTDQAWPVRATGRIETCIYHKSAMIGDALRSLSASSAASCQRDCESDQSCVAYTFHKADSRCNILGSVSDRTKEDPSSESGARMQNPC